MSAVPFRFACPGLHFAGCPEKATLVVAMGTRERDGMSVEMLQKAFRGEGWVLAASRAPVAVGDGPERMDAILDPLCNACAKKLAQEMAVAGGGRYGDGVRDKLTELLTPTRKKDPDIL